MHMEFVAISGEYNIQTAMISKLCDDSYYLYVDFEDMKYFEIDGGTVYSRELGRLPMVFVTTSNGNVLEIIVVPDTDKEREMLNNSEIIPGNWGKYQFDGVILNKDRALKDNIEYRKSDFSV